MQVRLILSALIEGALRVFNIEILESSCNAQSRLHSPVKRGERLILTVLLVRPLDIGILSTSWARISFFNGWLVKRSRPESEADSH